MAAGLGSRLGELTVAAPKALVEANGRALIEYAPAFAREAGGDRRIVVGGFHHDAVAARVAAADAGASMTENASYRKGNLLSLLAGKRGLDAAGSFLLMNTDHIYKPAIAHVVAAACARADEITAFCDYDRVLGADDMKVALDDEGRVRTMAKTLPAWDCGYVGMTFVPAARRPDYFAAVERVLASEGDAAHVETILVELAACGFAPSVADISGHGWLEIDEPHERAHAESVLRCEGWWS